MAALIVQASGVYRSDGNYITVMRTISSNESCLDRLFHFILKSEVAAQFLACCYLFRLSKKKSKKPITFTHRGEVPSSCLTCRSCTVAHYPES